VVLFTAIKSSQSQSQKGKKKKKRRKGKEGRNTQWYRGKEKTKGKNIILKMVSRTYDLNN
jgi:hypothetical protein